MFTAVSRRARTARGSFACIVLKNKKSSAGLLAYRESHQHVRRRLVQVHGDGTDPSGSTVHPASVRRARSKGREVVRWLITRFAPPILLLRHEKHDEGASNTGAGKAPCVHPCYSWPAGRGVGARPRRRHFVRRQQSHPPPTNESLRVHLYDALGISFSLGLGLLLMPDGPMSTKPTVRCGLVELWK
jgi:hypothetical protein